MNLNGAVLDLIEFQNKKIRQSFVFQKKESHKNGGGGGAMFLNDGLSYFI